MSARPEPAWAPLRDSDVEEVERALTDGDLQSDDPAERARVDSARLRLADLALVEELAAAGFAGPIFEIALSELASYGVAVMMAWMRTRQIFAKCRALGRPVIPPADWTWEDRLGIADETVARGLAYFLEEVLKPGKWDYRRGASLKTFFIGSCLHQFPNAFGRWATEQRHWARVHNGRTTLEDAQDQALGDAVAHGRVQWADPTGAEAVRTCEARQVLEDIADPQTRQAAALVFGLEVGHAEAGATVGLSADGVEGRLYRLRNRRTR